MLLTHIRTHETLGIPCISRCQVGSEKEEHNAAEDVGYVLYVESKVVTEEWVHQGFNHGKPKIDDEKCNDEVCNGLSMELRLLSCRTLQHQNS